jgi:hypothetical protein
MLVCIAVSYFWVDPNFLIDFLNWFYFWGLIRAFYDFYSPIYNSLHSDRVSRFNLIRGILLLRYSISLFKSIKTFFDLSLASTD